MSQPPKTTPNRRPVKRHPNVTPGQTEIQGSGARRAALRLIDAVLRRGETLDQATGPATSGLLTTSDHALARA
ncbi:MAG: SAM-dependent methyltransferase, partial [Croceibacterium sp.]